MIISNNTLQIIKVNWYKILHISESDILQYILQVHTDQPCPSEKHSPGLSALGLTSPDSRAMTAVNHRIS